MRHDALALSILSQRDDATASEPEVDLVFTGVALRVASEARGVRPMR